MEDKRRQLIREIDQTSKLLKQTQRNKEAALDRYLTLQTQIKKRQQLIETLRKEIEATDASIDRTNIAVDALNSDVQRLQEEYAEMLRVAYRQKLNNNSLLFIFSSSSLNEAFRRWQYLQQYDEYRQKQAALILETQRTLEQKVANLEAKRAEKETLLVTQQDQNNLLASELKDSDKLLNTLKKDESRLSADLSRQRKRREKLNQAIEDIIKKTMANRVENSRKTTPAAKNEEKEIVALTGNFERNKGAMKMPVNGVITRRFGRQPHPTLKNITIESPGIDIKTAQNAAVRAVFRGEVVGVQFVPGYNYMVIIKHGSYYTVYSNLADLKVKRGQTVKTRETIGKASTDRITNTTQIHFEVWKEKTRLNPARWVK